MKKLNKHFGKALVMARLAKGISLRKELRVADVAKMFSVSQSFWSQMEHGNKTPSDAMLARISKVFRDNEDEIWRAMLKDKSP